MSALYYVVDPGIEEMDFVHDSFYADSDEQAVDKLFKCKPDPRGYNLLRVEKIDVKDILVKRAQNN